MTAPDRFDTLRAFSVSLVQRIESDAARDSVSLEEVLTGIAVQHLEEFGQCPELEWVDFRHNAPRGQRSMLVHAWGEDEHSRLHLAAVLTPRRSVQEENLPYAFNRIEVVEALQRMLAAVEYLRDGLLLPGEEDPALAAMAVSCRRLLAKDSPEVVLHLFTYGQFRGTIPNQELEGALVTTDVRDFEWLKRMFEDETDRGEQLDFRDHDGGGLPCLIASTDSGGEPDVILTVLDGQFLAELYDRRRDELLRSNVRIYLRRTRKVNREIMESARTDPARFVALNNGISAVAAGASFSQDLTRIETINDLQIVNGGQTTATLHEVWRDRRNPADLSRVRVQAKITIVRPEVPASDDIAKRIAIAANTQNRITDSDLLSGDPRERSLELISRDRRYITGTVETGWFYERVRGQHAGLLAVDRRQERTFPKDQVIDKMMAAQFLLAWKGLPHQASLGREKALRFFKNLPTDGGGGGTAEVSEQEFDIIVGLATLRREAEGPIAAEGTMKPSVGFYLLAWLAEHHRDDIDLLQIARTGVLPERIIRLIQRVTGPISAVMRTHPAGVPHESERPKKPECWLAVRDVTVLREAETGEGLREFTRQDWQGALRWVQTTRNTTLRGKINDCIRIVQSGRVSGKRDFLAAVMREAIGRGFKLDLTGVRIE